jgi:hypothetical protein
MRWNDSLTVLHVLSWSEKAPILPLWVQVYMEFTRKSWMDYNRVYSKEKSYLRIPLLPTKMFKKKSRAGEEKLVYISLVQVFPSFVC